MSAKPIKGVIRREDVERQEREAIACPNCGASLRYTLKDGSTSIAGHFIPPSFGESGFWTCGSGE